MKTVLTLGLLLGVLPVLILAGIIELALRHLGASAWPDAIGFVVFGGLYLVLVCCGAYAFSHTKD